MSRTWKDQIQQSFKRHPDAPYWKYNWWLYHGDSHTRRRYNRIRRRRAKHALHEGRDPVKEVKYMPCVWW